MDVRDLDGTERDVLMALLAHMAEADDRIDAAEVMELDALAEELGVDDLRGDMMRARAVIQSRDDLLREAARVTRPGARELIRTLLYDLAQADGERSDEEQEMLAAITGVWPRG